MILYLMSSKCLFLNFLLKNDCCITLFSTLLSGVLQALFSLRVYCGIFVYLLDVMGQTNVLWMLRTKTDDEMKTTFRTVSVLWHRGCQQKRKKVKAQVNSSSSEIVLNKFGSQVRSSG